MIKCWEMGTVPAAGRDEVGAAEPKEDAVARGQRDQQPAAEGQQAGPEHQGGQQAAAPQPPRPPAVRSAAAAAPDGAPEPAIRPCGRLQRAQEQEQHHGRGTGVMRTSPWIVPLS